MSLKSSSTNGLFDQSFENFSRRLKPRQRGSFAAVAAGSLSAPVELVERHEQNASKRTGLRKRLFVI